MIAEDSWGLLRKLTLWLVMGGISHIQPGCDGFENVIRTQVLQCGQDVDRACLPGLDLSGVLNEHLAPCGDHHVPWRAVADEPRH